MAISKLWNIGIEVSNAVLRERFGISEANKAMASRIIKDTIAAEKIKLKDPDAVVKLRRYVPYWALFSLTGS